MAEDPNGGSFSERYRGTEWGQPTAPPAPQRRGTGPFLVLGAFVLALVAGVIVFALITFQPATPVAATPTIAARSATPRPTPRPEVGVLDAFWARIRDPRAWYHVSTQGEVVAAGEHLGFSMTLDVAGDDYAGVLSLAGEPKETPIVRKDGVVWVRGPDGRWVHHESDAAVYRQVPFMGLRNATELEYGGSTKVGGEILHKLVTTDRYRPSAGVLMLDPATLGASFDLHRLELLVTEAGVPRQAAFRLEMGGRDSAGEPLVHVMATYTFTNVGSAFTIEAPEP